MGELTANGYEVSTSTEIKTAVDAVFQAAWGAGIDLTATSPEGIASAKIADLLTDSENSGLEIYDNMNLNNASGTMLSNIAILRDTERGDGTKALLDVTLTSSSVPYTIPASTVFQILTTTELFQNATAISVASLSQTAQLLAKEVGVTGAVLGDPSLGHLQSQTYISQLTDIEIDTITDGTDIETDAELKTRLQTTYDPLSQGDVNAIYSALIDPNICPDVVKANVLENDTDTTDGNSVPAYTINVIVLGGTDQNVINAIYPKKSGGTPTYGSQSGNYTDSIGNLHTVYFDRASKTSLYVRATVTKKASQSAVDSSYNDIIKANCSAYVDGLKIGAEISYTDILSFFCQYRSFDIVTLEISDNNSTWVSANIDLDPRAYGELLTSNITITVT